ncbi:unnamed protein product [Pedinophyceae sp. YPF-701]|nr:unnamed protein product [Pedinophyceae sp. YPF-701]
MSSGSVALNENSGPITPTGAVAADQYNAISALYARCKLEPWRVFVEAFTLWKVIEKHATHEASSSWLKDKSVLDLACGNGHYARQLKARGAAAVKGVDISQEMIALAKQCETDQAQGVTYEVGDATHLSADLHGKHDLVFASYLLCYAQDYEHLLLMAQSIFAALKPGGRFVSVSDNTGQASASYADTAPYGFVKSCPEGRPLGCAIRYTFKDRATGEVFTFDNYYIPPWDIQRAFQKAGFASFRFIPLEADPAHADEFHDFLCAAPVIAMEAIK